MRSLRVAVVGATGLVGRTMLKVLEERGFPVSELILVASEKSLGSKIVFSGSEVEVVSIENALEMGADVALFSAGGAISLKWAHKFAEKGVTVIDNSSAFRMSPNHKLIIPEINGSDLVEGDLIIANPNCTTMQLVMALKPLHDRFRVKRGVVNTYQSVTGTGQAAIAQLEAERRGDEVEKVYPHNIDMNCLPHCDVFQENGYTKEEMKVHFETKKILGDEEIHLSCTAVRVPVAGGHSEAVYVEFEKDFELEEVRKLLEEFDGLILEDDPQNNVYPMPLNARGNDDVFVGRLRRDLAYEKGLHMWVVSDNLRKGAATNTIQIAEYLNSKGRWG
ncbi:MAG: aspartate-semialdehyde dehydrogenase [Crocinitomicaceae bacterium]|nr:aspartate-semialdehyde dehydrogenase [Crocinitomicaceae bacterium]